MNPDERRGRVPDYDPRASGFGSDDIKNELRQLFDAAGSPKYQSYVDHLTAQDRGRDAMRSGAARGLGSSLDRATQPSVKAPSPQTYSEWRNGKSKPGRDHTEQAPVLYRWLLDRVERRRAKGAELPTFPDWEEWQKFTLATDGGTVVKDSVASSEPKIESSDAPGTPVELEQATAATRVLALRGRRRLIAVAILVTVLALLGVSTFALFPAGLKQTFTGEKPPTPPSATSSSTTTSPPRTIGELEREYDGQDPRSLVTSDRRCVTTPISPRSAKPAVYGPGDAGPVGVLEIQTVTAKSEDTLLGLCPPVVWARVVWDDDVNARFSIPADWTLHIVGHRGRYDSFDATFDTHGSSIGVALGQLVVAAGECVFFTAYFADHRVLSSTTTGEASTECVQPPGY